MAAPWSKSGNSYEKAPGKHLRLLRKIRASEAKPPVVLTRMAQTLGSSPLPGSALYRSFAYPTTTDSFTSLPSISTTFAPSAAGPHASALASTSWAM